MPRSIREFSNPVEEIEGRQTTALFSRARDARGRFVKRESQRAKSFETYSRAQNSQRIFSVDAERPARKISRAGIISGKRQQVLKDLLAKGTEVYRWGDVDIVSRLPKEILERQLTRIPDILRFNYYLDGEARSILVNILSEDLFIKRAFKKGERIVKLRKDWQKQLNRWLANFIQRLKESGDALNLEFDFVPLGFFPYWKESKLVKTRPEKPSRAPSGPNEPEVEYEAPETPEPVSEPPEPEYEEEPEPQPKRQPKPRKRHVKKSPVRKAKPRKKPKPGVPAKGKKSRGRYGNVYPSPFAKH